MLPSLFWNSSQDMVLLGWFRFTKLPALPILHASSSIVALDTSGTGIVVTLKNRSFIFSIDTYRYCNQVRYFIWQNRMYLLKKWVRKNIDIRSVVLLVEILFGKQILKLKAYCVQRLKSTYCRFSTRGDVSPPSSFGNRSE